MVEPKTCFWQLNISLPYQLPEVCTGPTSLAAKPGGLPSPATTSAASADGEASSFPNHTSFFFTSSQKITINPLKHTATATQAPETTRPIIPAPSTSSSEAEPVTNSLTLVLILTLGLALPLLVILGVGACLVYRRRRRRAMEQTRGEDMRGIMSNPLALKSSTDDSPVSIREKELPPIASDIASVKKSEPCHLKASRFWFAAMSSISALKPESSFTQDDLGSDSKSLTRKPSDPLKRNPLRRNPYLPIFETFTSRESLINRASLTRRPSSVWGNQSTATYQDSDGDLDDVSSTHRPTAASVTIEPSKTPHPSRAFIARPRVPSPSKSSSSDSTFRTAPESHNRSSTTSGASEPSSVRTVIYAPPTTQPTKPHLGTAHATKEDIQNPLSHSDHTAVKNIQDQSGEGKSFPRETAIRAWSTLRIMEPLLDNALPARGDVRAPLAEPEQLGREHGHSSPLSKLRDPYVRQHTDETIQEGSAQMLERRNSLPRMVRGGEEEEGKQGRGRRDVK